MLSGASIRTIAEFAYHLSTDDIVGEFIKARVVDNKQEFGAMIGEMDEGAAEYGSKREKAELGLLSLRESKSRKLLPVASALINESFRKMGAGTKEEGKLNRFLIRDGFRYDRKSKAILPSVGKPKLEGELSSELDRRLRALNVRFVKMHGGIWDALASGGDDAARQSVSSSRELLRQVIGELAGKPGEKLERKAKVKLILGSKKNVEVVDSVARLANSLYGSSSAGEHTSVDTSSASLLGKMTEYCLLYILRRSKWLEKSL